MSAMYPFFRLLAGLMLMAFSVSLSAQQATISGRIATRNDESVSGVTIFTFYISTLRFKLIPRLLAGFGLLASLSQIAAVTMPLFGHAVDFRLIAPLGICEILLALWLIFKGFRSAGEEARAS